MQRTTVRFVAVLVSTSLAALAQINTGSMSGAVHDPSGLAMPGVEITVTATRTGLSRTALTDESGNWVLTGLEAGEYDVSASKSGFKRAALRGLNLSSSERLPVRTLVLEVGSTSESVTVRAEATAVQTQSADRSGLVTTAQIDSLLIQGRNPTSLVSLMPGVVMLGETQSLARDTTFSVMGNRRTANNVAIDGVPTLDIDNGFSQKLNVNMDAVAEVQVLLSNYQAEYGRNSGSNVNIITKSGSRDFHGLASYFKRHEQFNANNFFNNFVGLEKPRYRYNTWTYNIGGPVSIPGKFNRSRERTWLLPSDVPAFLNVPDGCLCAADQDKEHTFLNLCRSQILFSDLVFLLSSSAVPDRNATFGSPGMNSPAKSASHPHQVRISASSDPVKARHHVRNPPAVWPMLKNAFSTM